MNEILKIIIPTFSESLEFIGVLIIILGAIKSVYKLIVSKFDLDNIDIKFTLAKSLELGLGFKLAAEILKTVLIHTLDELIILSSIVILRVIMTFVIQWEIKNTEIKKEKNSK